MARKYFLGRMRQAFAVQLTLGTFLCMVIGLVTINAAHGQQWALDICHDVTVCTVAGYACLVLIVGLVASITCLIAGERT